MTKLRLLPAIGLLLLLKKQQDEEDDNDQTWNQRSLSAEGRRRRDRRYPRVALKRFVESPFKHLFDSGNEQALLNATGVDHVEFNRLLGLFKPIFDSHILDEKTGFIRRKVTSTSTTSGYRGRPRSIDAVGCLGLILMWYRTTGAVNRSLPLIFGLTQTPMDRWLRFGKRCLFVALDNFKPKLPSADDVQAYKQALSVKYPHAEDVAFAIDGCKMSIQASSNDLTQNRFYNGWLHGHFLSNVFVFAPDGKIICCVVNAPGSMHDAQVADYGIYDKLQFLYDEYNAKTVADSAFSAHRTFFVLSGDDDAAATPQELLQKRDATSIRQMSEWGMRQIKAKFPRLGHAPIVLEDVGQRRIDLSLMVRLYNHQVEVIGMNQILSTYMPQRSSEHRYFNQQAAINVTGDDVVLQMTQT
jgi:hypothetical protein